MIPLRHERSTHRISGSPIAKAAPHENTEFSFGPTDDPGVWRVKTEKEEFFIHSSDRATAYRAAAARVYGIQFKPEEPESDD